MIDSACKNRISKTKYKLCFKFFRNDSCPLNWTTQGKSMDSAIKEEMPFEQLKAGYIFK